MRVEQSGLKREVYGSGDQVGRALLVFKLI